VPDADTLWESPRGEDGCACLADIEIRFHLWHDRPRAGRTPAGGAALIVCHCQGVSDRSIREAVREGARSVRQVARACRAGRMCGGCRPAICEIISVESTDLAAPSFLPAEGLVGAG
jgi:bacterioferritin-associated ferredoxin